MTLSKGSDSVSESEEESIGHQADDRMLLKTYKTCLRNIRRPGNIRFAGCLGKRTMHKRKPIFWLTIVTGIALSAGVAFWVRLWSPTLAAVVFALLCWYWVRSGWKYAEYRDTTDNPFSRAIQAELSARKDETLSALADALYEAKTNVKSPEPDRQTAPVRIPAHRHKILVFHSYVEQAQTFRILLEGWGYDVAMTTNVLDAMIVSVQQNFDLVILDLCHSYVQQHLGDFLRARATYLFVGCCDHRPGPLLPIGSSNFVERPVDPDLFRQKVLDILGGTASYAAGR